MRFKLDECMDVRLAALFEASGHDVETVFSENVSGSSDRAIYTLCLKEKRTLVTQDLDFSNPFIFDPSPTEGIVVLRNPSQLTSDLRILVQKTLTIFSMEKPLGHLWIVGRNGVRIWPG